MRVALVWKRLVSRVFHFKLFNTSTDLTSYEEPVITLSARFGIFCNLCNATLFCFDYVMLRCFVCSAKGYTVGQEEIIMLEIKPTSHTGVLLSSSSTKGDYIVLEMIDGNVSM